MPRVQHNEDCKEIERLRAALTKIRDDFVYADFVYADGDADAGFELAEEMHKVAKAALENPT